MNRTRIAVLTTLLLLGISPAWTGDPPNEGTLQVVVTSTRNAQGSLRVALFTGSEGFPGHDEHAVGRVAIPASIGPVTVRFEKVQPGEYAVAVLHDEDDNGRMRTNWIGMPREGYGTSNNPEGRPKYKKSRFNFEGRELSIKIHLVYR